MLHWVATVSRTGLFLDKPGFIITEDTGKSILDWCNSGIQEKEDVRTIINNNLKISQNGNFTSKAS
jgi:hypothetical protein